MHYEGDRETGEPDPVRQDEQHELAAAEQVEALTRAFGKAWMRLAVERVDVTPRPSSAPMDVDESAIPI